MCLFFHLTTIAVQIYNELPISSAFIYVYNLHISLWLLFPGADTGQIYIGYGACLFSP